MQGDPIEYLTFFCCNSGGKLNTLDPLVPWCNPSNVVIVESGKRTYTSMSGFDSLSVCCPEPDLLIMMQYGTILQVFTERLLPVSLCVGSKEHENSCA